MEPEDTVTSRRAFLATGGTVAFGSGVAYFAAGGDLSGDSASADAERSRALANVSEEPTAREDVDRTTETETPEPELTTGVDLDVSARPVAGADDARVDVYYWTDYLCPFCERFERETLPKLTSEYVEPGDVRLVALGLPVIHDRSWNALDWSRCVWRTVGDDDPAAFWRWHDAVFEAQESDDTEWANDETFAEITEETTGVSLEAVRTCRESHGEEARSTVEADAAAAERAGFQGTPAFVLYNRATGAAAEVAGAQPYENFVDAIEYVSE
jgi:protein-disulfide isomerase